MIGIALGFIRAFLIFLAGLPMILIGLVITPIALLFRKESTDIKPFTQFPGSWWMVSLPAWAKYFDNPSDGALGDTRGWWNNYCLETYGFPATHFWAMFEWMAVRNSVNYWSRITTGVDESRCKVTTIAEGKYWNFMKAVRDDGKVFPLFEGLIPYGDGKCLEWRIGWKLDFDTITPDMPEQDRFRGSVFRIRPWKAV